MASFDRSIIDQNLNYKKAVATSKDGTSVAGNKVGLPFILKENPSASDLNKTPELKYGVPSFINPYAVLAFPTAYSSQFNSIIDDPSSSIKFSSGRNGIGNLEPTVYNLVSAPPDGSGNVFKAKMPYRYTDFLYCKYYGIIPNNYLITLRRYPAPTFDNLAIPMAKDDINKDGVQFNFKPIAQAVTWIGEEPENKLSDILGFDVSMNWKLFESEVANVSGNEQDSSQGPKVMQSASKFLTITSGILSGKPNTDQDRAQSQYDPYQNGPYSHRVYGPVNVIGKTYKRDRGIDFKQSFSLNFHYSLKSIAGINPKAAMLDIMSNMLQLTYNNAAFWGGANRYFAEKPVYPFLGGRGGMNAWYRGDPLAFSTEVKKQIAGNLELVSKFFDTLKEDPIGALKKLAMGGLSAAMISSGAGKAPDIVAMKALLTGEPIGEWHMVVGNPYSPILNVGNLICTGAKFNFNDILGADNFPTELKVTITMEHGRPRDKGDIESMFNDGQGRIYYAPANRKDAFSSSALDNSENDSSYKIRRNRPEVPDSAPGIGADVKLDQIIDNYQNLFEHGHDLAIKMGLASAGKYKLPAPK